MPKTAKVQSEEHSDQFYFAENNKCLGLISMVLGLIALALVIPWAIWCFTSSLWPTSEAQNHTTVTWICVAVLAMFIVPFVAICLACALAMCCKSASPDLKQCFVLSHAIFTLLSSAFKAAWGIFGCTLLVNVESNSGWFMFSIFMIDLLLLMYIIPFLWTLMFCFQTMCCPNKQQKRHAKKYANLDEY